MTSGPGATNAVTGLTDALMDSIPIWFLTGQVPTFMIGNDAFQEADTVGITRPCTKHNWLVRRPTTSPIPSTKPFTSPPPAVPVPVLIDIPKDVQFADGTYTPKKNPRTRHYAPSTKGDTSRRSMHWPRHRDGARSRSSILAAASSTPALSQQLLRELVADTNFPITSTLMGLGAYPASGDNWLGMLGHAWPVRSQHGDA